MIIKSFILALFSIAAVLAVPVPELSEEVVKDKNLEINSVIKDVDPENNKYISTESVELENDSSSKDTPKKEDLPQEAKVDVTTFNSLLEEASSVTMEEKPSKEATTEDILSAMSTSDPLSTSTQNKESVTESASTATKVSTAMRDLTTQKSGTSELKETSATTTTTIAPTTTTTGKNLLQGLITQTSRPHIIFEIRPMDKKVNTIYMETLKIEEVLQQFNRNWLMLIKLFEQTRKMNRPYPQFSHFEPSRHDVFEYPHDYSRYGSKYRPHHNSEYDPRFQSSFHPHQIPMSKYNWYD